jgi:hypothetical protein
LSGLLLSPEENSIMTDINPYASPLSSEPYLPSQEELVTATLVERRQFEQGLFRKGNQLVMHRLAMLPNRCVKSGEPANDRLRRNLSWHHPAIYLTLLISILIYAILAIVLRRKATVYVGLSEAWFRKRRRAIGIGWTVALLGLATMIISFILFSDPRSGAPWAGWVVLLGVLMILGGAIYGILFSQIITPARITDQYVWIKGVHPSLLADLPDWPYQP